MNVIMIMSKKKIIDNPYPTKGQALKLAVEKGYITKEEMMAEMNKPKPKRKVVKKPKPRIIYGLNTNSM
jgi:hypothetical protein